MDYQFLRASADGNLTRYLIAYPAERVSVNGGENLSCDNFRSAITREGHVLLTWERGPGATRGIHYCKIGFLDLVQSEPRLLRYRERIRIRNERQPAGYDPAGDAAAPLTRDAFTSAPPLAPWPKPPGLTRDAGATPSEQGANVDPLTGDAAVAPLRWDANVAAIPRDAAPAPLTRDAGAGHWRGQPNVFILNVHGRNQRLSAVEERSQAVFRCTSSGKIHTCQAFLRYSHGAARLVCSEHVVKAGQRLSLRPTELVGAQFMCAGVLSIDWILEVGA